MFLFLYPGRRLTIYKIYFFFFYYFFMFIFFFFLIFHRFSFNFRFSRVVSHSGCCRTTYRLDDTTSSVILYRKRRRRFFIHIETKEKRRLEEESFRVFVELLNLYREYLFDRVENKRAFSFLSFNLVIVLSSNENKKVDRPVVKAVNY